MHACVNVYNIYSIRAACVKKRIWIVGGGQEEDSGESEIFRMTLREREDVAGVK